MPSIIHTYIQINIHTYLLNSLNKCAGAHQCAFRTDDNFESTTESKYLNQAKRWSKYSKPTVYIHIHIYGTCIHTAFTLGSYFESTIPAYLVPILNIFSYGIS